MKSPDILTDDLRMTPQRREVFEVLRSSQDHPTATDVFIRAKERMPSISLATVYNCLEALVGHGLIRQVNIDRGSSRFCNNMKDHVHFHCERCGKVLDVFPRYESEVSQMWKLPEGADVTRVDIAMHGCCPECTSPRSA